MACQLVYYTKVLGNCVDHEKKVCYKNLFFFSLSLEELCNTCFFFFTGEEINKLILFIVLCKKLTLKR